MGLVRNWIESEKELKVIAKEMRKEEFLENNKEFQELHHLSDEEMLFFDYLYRKERKYRAAVLILILICAGLALSIWM